MTKFLFIIAIVTVLIGCQKISEIPETSKFQLWAAKQSDANNIDELKAFLADHNVENIFPLEQLLRSDVRWEKCESKPFAIPPKDQWANMVPTLEFIRDQIIPLIGQVEAQSVYRHPKINDCVGGATKSFHMRFFAIDMKPKADLSRQNLIEKLCALHKKTGSKHSLGLGIYKRTRFHIDTAGYRSWGHDKRSASSPCRTI